MSLRLALLSLLLLLSPVGAQAATVLQTAPGGRVVLDQGVLCGPSPEGWTFEADRKAAIASALLASGTVVDVHTATDLDSCANPRESVSLLASDLPVIDPGSVAWWPDEGRLEVSGVHLNGLQVHGQLASRTGDDVCHSTATPSGVSPGGDHCVLGLGRGHGMDSVLTWLPAGVDRDDALTIFANNGKSLPASMLKLKPTRIVLARVLPATSGVELTDGFARILLPHPDAIASVDCGLARCELTDGAIVVRSVSGQSSAVAVRVRLAPHVFVQRGDALDGQVVATFTLLHCPIALASGTPVRDLDDLRVVVRMDARCSKDVRSLRWMADANLADVLRVEKDADAVFVLLRVGRIVNDRVTVTASRADPDAPILAALTSPTQPQPHPLVALEMPGYGPIEFVPKNRDALVKVARPDDHMRLVVLPVPGVYQSRPQVDGFLVRGEETASGSVALRFGLRADSLPPSLAGVDLAILGDALQRPLREASVQVPLAGNKTRPAVVELICADENGDPQVLATGDTPRIGFDKRETCRIVIHRSRLKPEDGPQDVQIEVDVAALDGINRSGTHISERAVLRPGLEDRTFWIHGVKAPFDRISARVYHIVDEAHFQGGQDAKSPAAALQWTVITGTGRLRFYATASFPTGLYRTNQPTGLLTLNFGVLSRLVLLDHDGKESLFGLELGAIGIGLVGTGNFPNYPATLAAVGGIGIGVPLGNIGQVSQASLNLHAWVAYEFRPEFMYYDSITDATNLANGKYATHWAFIFGPSISIGNIGVIL
jgi:hypothetical protein